MSKNNSISNNSVKHKYVFKCKYGLSKTFLFQAIQFTQIIQLSISIDRALSYATTPG